VIKEELAVKRKKSYVSQHKHLEASLQYMEYNAQKIDLWKQIQHANVLETYCAKAIQVGHTSQNHLTDLAPVLAKFLH